MRGDVHVLKAPRGAPGHEQRGARYAVVLQSDLLPLSTWLVAPTSRSAQVASFRPEVEIEKQSTLVLVEQTAAVSPERLGPAVGHLTRAELDDVDAALRAVLGLGHLSRGQRVSRRVVSQALSAELPASSMAAS